MINAFSSRIFSSRWAAEPGLYTIGSSGEKARISSRAEPRVSVYLPIVYFLRLRVSFRKADLSACFLLSLLRLPDGWAGLID